MKSQNYSTTKIHKIKFRNLEFYILRDDLLGEFNGNKARKLEFLLNTDLSSYDTILSHGSSQSNAMQSLSVFARIKGLKFRYAINYLNSNLAKNPVGNLKSALENGMELLVMDEILAKNSNKFLSENLAQNFTQISPQNLALNFQNKTQTRREFALSFKDEKTLFIEEGVAMREAEMGFITQAKEIESFARKNELEFDIFLPSGTGTSAGYLAKHSRFRVFTCPCVGDKSYLEKQLKALNLGKNLTILNPPKKYHFADLKPELYGIYKEILDETGTEFDLIYDPVGLLTLFANLGEFRSEILYIHQGGILGNTSQLMRYRYKGVA